MGFLKRFFSLGSKKSKKNKRDNRQNTTDRVDASGRIVRSNTPEPWQTRDGDANRLLRSSSAHFRVVREVDYSTLPPLPHPINTLAITPTPSPVATPASTPGLRRRGTYTVTVHERQCHSRTEFPHANPPLEAESPTPNPDPHFFDDSPVRSRADSNDPFTPHEKGRLLRLRQDPSVVSLLNMYDDKGHIKSCAFSNTPPNPAPVQDVLGREQKKRNGSTLRELLGESEQSRPGHIKTGSMLEGDISWAERYLGEHGLDDSFALDVARGPLNFRDHTPNMSTTTTDISLPYQDAANQPSVSSMVVEVSEASNRGHEVSPQPTQTDPSTPKTASEVFGFIPERRKSLRERARGSTQIPTLLVSRMSTCSTSSDDRVIPSTPDRLSVALTTYSNSSPGNISDTSYAQIHTATITKLTPVLNPLATRSTDTLNILRALTPTPASREWGSLSGRGTRGPRTSSASFNENDSGETERYPKFVSGWSDSTANNSNDVFTRPRPRQQRRTASQTSKAASVRSNPDDFDLNDSENIPPPSSARHRRASNRSRRSEKENSRKPKPPTPMKKSSRRPSNRPSTTSGSNIPKPLAPVKSLTPAKNLKSPQSQIPRHQQRSASDGSYSHPRTLVEVRHATNGNGENPSPASSSELSPVGKDMMATLRKQRSRVRDEMNGAGKHFARR